MKKFITIETDDNENLDKIISEKRYTCDNKDKKCKECSLEITELCNKKILEKQNSMIKERYSIYNKNIENLDFKNRKREKEAFQSLYNSTTTSKNIMKEIKDKNRVNHPNCPYCGIASGETIEHILPKDVYPEYSIFSKNLIPCCSQCNSLKGTKIKDENGEYETLNFYEDDIPKKEFIEIKISRIQNGIPIIEYKILETANQIFKNHFKTLNLIQRYRENANSIISEITESINRNRKETTKEKMRKQLIQQYEIEREVHGYNYWRGLVKLAIANSEEYINYLYGPYRDNQAIDDLFEVSEDVEKIEIQIVLIKKGFRNIEIEKDKIISKNQEIEIQINSKIGYDKIFWKIKNEGKEAEDKDDIGGKIFKSSLGKTLNINTTNNEKIIVECFLIKDNICIGKGKRILKIQEID